MVLLKRICKGTPEKVYGWGFSVGGMGRSPQVGLVCVCAYTLPHTGKAELNPAAPLCKGFEWSGDLWIVLSKAFMPLNIFPLICVWWSRRDRTGFWLSRTVTIQPSSWTFVIAELTEFPPLKYNQPQVYFESINECCGVMIRLTVDSVDDSGVRPIWARCNLVN